MKRLCAGFMMLFILAAPVCLIAGPALNSVKATVTTVLDTLKDPKLKGEAGKKAKAQKIEAVADNVRLC